MLDLIIRGGQVVTPQGVGNLEIGVQDGRIAAVAHPGVLPKEAGKVIDASGKIVLPGGIEPHTHIGIPVPEQWAGRSEVITQPPEAASRAAAFGGVTTLLDFSGELPLTPEDKVSTVPISRQLESRQAAFKGHSYTDFSFHHILAREVTDQTLGQIGEAIQSGQASFKIFTTFLAKVPSGHLQAVFEKVAKHGGIMAVHAEDDDMVTFTEQKLKREGNDQGYNLHLVHSNISEDVSFRKVIRQAEHAGVGIYFVHVTAKEGVIAISEARDKGQPVYGEALHNYLEFTCDDYKKPEGTKIHTYPAIKYADDRDELKAGLSDGRLATTATDDYTTYKDVKLSGQTVETVCGGHNGIETRVPVSYTKFVSEGGMSLPRFADIVSTNAAKILGMYPQKGVIAAGSDADFMLIDPTLNKTLTLDDLHSDSDYSIWEGFKCLGYPVMTILRGKVIVENGQLIGDSTDGTWLSRKVSPEVVSLPVV